MRDKMPVRLGRRMQVSAANSWNSIERLLAKTPLLFGQVMAFQDRAKKAHGGFTRLQQGNG